MKRFYAITGTPGTGKKTVAPLVSEAMGLDCFGLNDLAEKWRLVGKGGEVDGERLGRRVSSQMKSKAVLFGHLVPYSLRRGDLVRVAVLRCEPSILRGRLQVRGYGKTKLRSNVEAELIGTVSYDSLKAFGPLVCEVDTSELTPRDVAAKVLGWFAGKRESSGRQVGHGIDWTLRYDSSAKLSSLLR